MHATLMLGEKILAIEVVVCPWMPTHLSVVVGVALSHVAPVDPELEVLRGDVALPLVLGAKAGGTPIVSKGADEGSGRAGLGGTARSSRRSTSSSGFWSLPDSVIVVGPLRRFPAVTPGSGRPRGGASGAVRSALLGVVLGSVVIIVITAIITRLFLNARISRRFVRMPAGS
jgi:hypothetical protein